jgi:hypothetical protein
VPNSFNITVACSTPEPLLFAIHEALTALALAISAVRTVAAEGVPAVAA